MSAYVIINDQILDESVFAEFRERVGATVEAHGGRYLVRGGNVDVIEGGTSIDRVVVIEFDDADRARTWLNSPEYKELHEIRKRSANAVVIIAEGL